MLRPISLKEEDYRDIFPNFLEQLGLRSPLDWNLYVCCLAFRLSTYTIKAYRAKYRAFLIKFQQCATVNATYRLADGTEYRIPPTDNVTTVIGTSISHSYHHITDTQSPTQPPTHQDDWCNYNLLLMPGFVLQDLSHCFDSHICWDSRSE